MVQIGLGSDKAEYSLWPNNITLSSGWVWVCRGGEVGRILMYKSGLLCMLLSKDFLTFYVKRITDTDCLTKSYVGLDLEDYILLELGEQVKVVYQHGCMDTFYCIYQPGSVLSKYVL